MSESIRPIMFLYLSGAIDIFLTIICVFTGWGVETNTLYNWIVPNWLMCLAMILVNTAFCIFMAVACSILQKNYDNPFAKSTLILWGSLFYLGGIGRTVFGAGSCIGVMIQVMTR